MASIQKRKNKDGTTHWRAVIRLKGHPTVCAHFDRKQEADDWAASTEREIRSGRYNFYRADREKTFADLVDQYLSDGAIEHLKSAADSRRHLQYFKDRIGAYALVHVTSDLLLAERKKLAETPTHRGRPRNPATTNRYMAALSSLLTYACRHLRWIRENPCANLLKLKARPKQRRILTQEEVNRLLEACKKSKNAYLYLITLMALTTGARKGEILALTWDCIDFESRLAHIQDSKNGKPRRIGLVDTVIQELHVLHSQRNPAKKHVFASKTAFGEIDIKKAWQNALKKAEIDDFVFHGLRHHFASFGGQIGASAVQLRTQLGHSSSSMTDHYTAHLDAEATRFIGEAIEQQILVKD